ncbi:putative acetamidase [Yamadazyma tenuis]|uniref:Amidase domain-containing protein n=1 Tax=Candida tenuis (strain ATCC 10573 / BCRC 21748 / CBS 615 / JCM 9827 / NBRC 10315 / NRRL Y-1498 / VKM Y-70) TaxID=590646 RepID=G3B2Z8_CANTC|nr:uncharacterized protein CANTEDRAFT_122085 [Yamadazyma tenuis ATCC 10573]EGV64045.1 hypothetical protein CANTEDRAFT_122085 [Yamadazyma tenuis ATCC 10573]WEJ96328.1 putative acetamidase [Yamadazyma tenuis]
MTTWIDVRDTKIASQQQLLKPFLAPEKLVPAPEELNDVSDFIDTSSVISNDIKYITNLDIPALLAEYSTGALTARQVTEAYCYRATLAHQLTNCLTEIRFQEALHEAEKLDEYYQKHNCLNGPLHGVIVSFKDNINIEGVASSMGFVGEAEEIKTESSTFAKLLTGLGAIIICKTNTSAGMIYSETTNVLWGRTLNPFNRRYLNVGGSSGGEGALALLKGSCFGIGSDIGGSVRHPAALNRVYSLKPSSGRFPKFGTVSGQEGQESIVSVYGILTRSFTNLDYVTKSIIENKPYLQDASCLPMKYTPAKLPAKLTVGFMKSDGLTTVTSPLIRGLEIVKEALRKEGHTVLEWDDTYFKEIRDTIYPFYGADGMKHVKSILAKYNEPPDSHIVASLPVAEDMQVSDLWQSQKKRAAYAQKYLDLWNNGGGPGVRLDAVICACSPYPACLWNKVTPQPLNSIWNALDYSAGTFPVTRCDVSIDKPLEKTSFISDTDKLVHQTYSSNLDKFEGGPVSLQVVCGKLEEEKCAALIGYVSELLDKRV